MNDSLILIVDDMTKNLQLMGTVLRKKGYDIALATNGREALDTLKERPADLVLLDIMMPEMDGYEVCKKMKSDKHLKKIPVIFLTGKSDSEDVVKGFEMGAADYITKPFNTTELLLRVKTQVELKKSQDELREKNLALKQLNARKDLFFSIISHDLKSPFQGLIGLTELLYEDIDSMEREDILEFSKMIHESARNLLNLLENLLEWSILERNKKLYSPEKTDLNKLINKVIQLYSAMSMSKKIKLINISDKPVMAWVDQNMITTVIRNILSNAIKFSPENGEVRISTAASSNGAILQVTDSGIGMDEKTLNNLFRIEEMKSRPGTRNEKGTGLGLLICKELVNKNNGRLTVDSIPGKGTTFTVLLPQKELPESAVKKTPN